MESGDEHTTVIVELVSLLFVFFVVQSSDFIAERSRRAA